MSTINCPPPLDKLPGSSQIHRKLPPGDSLFIQNEATSGLFYLVAGAIDLKRVTKSGHSVMIHRARPGDTFAEASIFSDSYHCSATAACETLVIEFKRATILQLLDTDIEFVRSMASRFAAQIQETRRHVELLSIRSADERIIAALHDGLLVEDITTFAEAIGLVPETVYRALARLSQEGQIVKTARGQYQLDS